MTENSIAMRVEDEIKPGAIQINQPVILPVEKPLEVTTRRKPNYKPRQKKRRIR
jgi:hypothetical protein